ncbi:hypothetical protein GCG21_09100 [Pseudactinotalea sp. HY160]|uniref:hypothetical protein n=1 Tax=Pseudactinotalea sp. HY160 TaxID=2654490 RepID=UPI00128E2E1F|nr:hypothetical protein [Pseudactinotalea sp. HY160]MPV50159.1 hypothetical protein [Pseudactinotalea sp. HY160]
MTRLHIDPYDERATDAAEESALRASRPRPSGSRRSARQTCIKRRYQSKTQALHALHTIQTASNRQHVPERTYECDRCQGWHLTSQSGSPKVFTLNAHGADSGGSGVTGEHVAGGHVAGERVKGTGAKSGILVDLDAHRAWATLHDAESPDASQPDAGNPGDDGPDGGPDGDGPSDGPGAGALPVPRLFPVVDLSGIRGAGDGRRGHAA